MPKTFNLVLEKFNFSAKEELKLMLQKLEISDVKNKIHTEKIKNSAKKREALEEAVDPQSNRSNFALFNTSAGIPWYTCTNHCHYYYVTKRYTKTRVIRNSKAPVLRV